MLRVFHRMAVFFVIFVFHREDENLFSEKSYGFPQGTPCISTFMESFQFSTSFYERLCFMTYSILSALYYKEYSLLREKLRNYEKLLLLYWLFGFLGLYPLWLAVSLGQCLWMLSPFALFALEGSFPQYLTHIPSAVEKGVYARYTIGFLLGGLSTLGNLLMMILWLYFAPELVPLALASLLPVSLLCLWILALGLPLFYSRGRDWAKPWFFLSILTPVGFVVINQEIITNSIWLFYRFWTVFTGILLTAFVYVYSYRKAKLYMAV